MTAIPGASVPVGTPVTLIASPGTLVSPRYIFSLGSSGVQGIAIIPTPNSNTATVTSSVAGTVTIIVAVVGASGQQSTTSITLTFGGTASAGALQLTSSPGTYVSSGTPVTLFANTPNIPNAIYSFTILSTTQSGASISQIGNSSSAIVRSYTAATVTIKAVAYSSSNYGLQATSIISLSFR